MATVLKNLSSYNKNDIPNGKEYTIGIVVSEWNDSITNALCEGAITTLTAHGVKEKNILIHYVPGTYELPLGAQLLIEHKEVDAVICVGCVIQGETKHFDFICDAAATGIMRVNLEYNTPVIFTVLTTNTLEQAQERSGGKHGNKGVEGAITALKMLALEDQLVNG